MKQVGRMHDAALLAVAAQHGADAASGPEISAILKAGIR
jgi:hypothetical protein